MKLRLQQYFITGATQKYKEQYIKVRRMAQNFHKGFVSDEIKNIVRQNFSREVEFYEFCKERLITQLQDSRKLEE